MKCRSVAVLLAHASLTAVGLAQDPTAAPPTGSTAGHDGNFFLQSADGRNRLQLGALFQAQARVFQPDRGRDTEFLLERMRLEIGGTIEEVYRFNFEPNFTEDEVELEEAWFGGILPGGAELILGRMKEPFGLEEMLPRAPQDWVNFSILNQFSPAEDHGITLLGALCDDSLEYGLAFYNGSGGDETNSDKDVAARLVWKPFAGEECCLAGLQLGVAGTFGRADAMLTGKSLRNEAKQDFLRFAPGTRMDGDRWRAGLEAGWLCGPFAVLAELLMLEQEMVGSAGRDDVTIDGGYVGFSWVLTGEDKTWRGIDPAHPFGAGNGWGAWQFATRVSRLSLDPTLMTIGAVGSTGFTDTVTTIDAGLNWHLTKLAMVRMHALWTDYDERIGIGGTTFGDELSILLQAQFKF